MQPCRSAGSVEGYGAQIAPPLQTSPDAPQLVLVHGPVYCADAARNRDRNANSCVGLILDLEGLSAFRVGMRWLELFFVFHLGR